MANGYIDDFGQKIGGAKKDRWKEIGLGVEDLDDIDLREYMQYVTKENIWSAPEYVGYISAGMEPVCIYFMRFVREKLAAKTEIRNDGKDRERAEKYITFVNNVRKTCESIKKKEEIPDFVDKLIVGNSYYNPITHSWYDRARDVTGLDNKFLRTVKLSKYDVQELYYETEIQGFPYNFRGDLKGVTIKQSYHNDKYWIVKGRKILNRSKEFDTVEEALDYAKTTLIEALDNKKKENKRESKTIKIVRPQLRHVERTGTDIRKGHNASTDILLNRFKFRGGEFGNWNTQDDRQAYVNYAFDAFIDLAYVLKCPLEFISFYPKGSYNGQTLAIAFGARGSGSALAHYECGRVVINLTKMKGAGCLAHEWGHALDDFLGTQCGLKGLKGFISSAGYRKSESYPQIIEAFATVRDAMRSVDKTTEEIISDYKAEVERLQSRLKGWVTHALQAFDREYGKERRAANNDEITKMNEIVNKLYETTDSKYASEMYALYKSVKRVSPSKDARDQIDLYIRLLNSAKYGLSKAMSGELTSNRHTKDSDFYKSAKKLDKGRAKAYYSEPEEMFARCFESYIEDKLGFKSQYLVHSTKNNTLYGELKPYPEGTERENINNAIENLMKVVVETFATEGKPFNTAIYENNTDWSDKYGNNEYKKGYKEDSNRAVAVKKETPKKLVTTGLIRVISGYDEILSDVEANAAITKTKDILNSFGKYTCTDAKYTYKKVNNESTLEVTFVECQGLLNLNIPKEQEILIENIKELVREKAGALDAVVKIISPELENSTEELAIYKAAVVKAAQEANIKKEAPNNVNIQVVDKDIKKEVTITQTQELRQTLVEKANELMKGDIACTESQLWYYINNIAKRNNIIYFALGIVPDKEVKGNSKVWTMRNGVIVINIKATVEKRIEGAIEALTRLNVSKKYGNTSEADMIASGVAYMICKRVGLDVRTYCLDSRFERLVTNKKQLESYLNICIKIYNEIISVLELQNVIKK